MIAERHRAVEIFIGRDGECPVEIVGHAAIVGTEIGDGERILLDIREPSQQVRRRDDIVGVLSPAYQRGLCVGQFRRVVDGIDGEGLRCSYRIGTIGHFIAERHRAVEVGLGRDGKCPVAIVGHGAIVGIEIGDGDFIILDIREPGQQVRRRDDIVGILRPVRQRGLFAGQPWRVVHRFQRKVARQPGQFSAVAVNDSVGQRDQPVEVSRRRDGETARAIGRDRGAVVCRDRADRQAVAFRVGNAGQKVCLRHGVEHILGAVGQSRIGRAARCVIHPGEVDRESAAVGPAVAVGHRHREIERCVSRQRLDRRIVCDEPISAGGLVQEQGAERVGHAVGEADFHCRHLPGDRIGRRCPGIGVGRGEAAGHVGEDVVARRIRHAARGDSSQNRIVIRARQRDRQRLGVGGGAAIRHGQVEGDVLRGGQGVDRRRIGHETVGAGGLVQEQRAERTRQLVGKAVFRRRCLAGHRIGGRIAGVRIVGNQSTGDVGEGIIRRRVGQRCRVGLGQDRRIIRAGDRKGDILRCGAACVPVIHRHRVGDVKPLACGQEIEIAIGDLVGPVCGVANGGGVIGEPSGGHVKTQRAGRASIFGNGFAAADHARHFRRHRMGIRRAAAIERSHIGDVDIVKRDRPGQGLAVDRAGLDRARILGQRGGTRGAGDHRRIIGAGEGQHDVAACGRRAVRDRDLIFLGERLARGQIVEHGVVEVEVVENRPGIGGIGACGRKEARREGADIGRERCCPRALALHRLRDDLQVGDIARIDVIEGDRACDGVARGVMACVGRCQFGHVRHEIRTLDDIGRVIRAIHAESGGHRVSGRGDPVRRGGGDGISQCHVNELAIVQRVEYGCVAVEGDGFRPGRAQSKGCLGIRCGEAGGNVARGQHARGAGDRADIVGVEFGDVGHPDFSGAIGALAKQVDGDICRRRGRLLIENAGHRVDHK